jgi:tRNA wybutosine-synthesizing protein 1
MHGLNDNSEALSGFSTIISKHQPTYVEVKAYMHIGYSTKRLERSVMPTFSQITAAAEEISKQTGYQIAGRDEDSRVVLLKK